MRLKSARTGGRSFAMATFTGRVARDVLALRERRGDNFRHRMGLELQFEFAGIEARHFGGVADQLVQAVALFVDDGE